MADARAKHETEALSEPTTQLDARSAEPARRAIALAQDEARRYGHDYVGTEHLLLGLLDVGDGIAALALRTMGADGTKVRSAIETIIRRGERTTIEGEVELTPRAMNALSLAANEARLMGHSSIGAEHLLLGLIREGEGIAAGVLQSLGITLEAARAAVVDAILLYRNQPEASPPKSNVVTCRIDDRDMDAINALVEAGARATRSEAAAWLIHSGIEANRELLDKLYGAVMEIRRLREEIARTLQEPAAVEQT